MTNIIVIIDILRRLKLNDVYQERLGDNENINETDSAIATAMVLDTAINHYGNGVIHIATKPMGLNDDHWWVYVFPVISGKPNESRSCYLNAL